MQIIVIACWQLCLYRAVDIVVHTLRLQCLVFSGSGECPRVSSTAALTLPPTRRRRGRPPSFVSRFASVIVQFCFSIVDDAEKQHLVCNSI